MAGVEATGLLNKSQQQQNNNRNSNNTNSSPGKFETDLLFTEYQKYSPLKIILKIECLLFVKHVHLE